MKSGRNRNKMNIIDLDLLLGKKMSTGITKYNQILKKTGSKTKSMIYRCNKTPNKIYQMLITLI